MERLTEYHNGVAVIKDKSRLKEAMEKLAQYEEKEEFEKSIIITVNNDGVCELYDNTWDITIHCTSEEEHKRTVEFIQSVAKRKWIPCSERLPEDEKTKLVTLSDGNVEGAFWNERNWWCMGDSINLETRTEDVIAWMPLPEPYKAEKV